MHSCQGRGTTSFTNFLGEGNWDVSLGMGVVTVSAAQQGVLNCLPDQLQRRRNSPLGEGRGVGLAPSHCT